MRAWHVLAMAGATVATASLAAYVLSKAPRLPLALTLEPLVQPSEIQSPALNLDYAVLPLPALLGLAQAAARVREARAWTRSDALLSRIAVDFGRSHYFVLDQTSLPDGDAGAFVDVPRVVNRHCFDGGASVDERKLFFSSLGLDPDFALDACSQVSPTRNAVVCRVKYELFVQYLVRCGRSEEKARQEALLALGVATQGPLHYLKARVSERVTAHTALTISWAYFQLKYSARPEGLVLTFALSSTLPVGEGLWQAHRHLSPPSEPIARATCTLYLSTDATIDTIDLGSARIDVQPSRPLPLDPHAKQPWGVYDSDLKQVIPFRDTSPTW